LGQTAASSNAGDLEVYDFDDAGIGQHEMEGLISL
jgi:hypothetical protein